MRIGVNGLCCNDSMTGIGRVALSTMRALLELDPHNEYFFFLPRDAPQDLQLEADNLVLVPTEVSLKDPVRSTLFEEFTMPRRLRGARVDLYYAPSFLLPAFPGARTEIVCIHDFAFRLYPETKSTLFRTYMNARLPSALKRAQRIVCVSQATADDLVLLFPEVERERVRVVRPGVDPKLFRPDRRVARADPPFVAFVGNDDPRKNVRSLVDAFPVFRARLRPHQLVVVGPTEAPPNHGREVVVKGYLSDPELVKLYHQASMVVHPSFYEGFGLPVLESMACGTPVACANIRAFREVAGDCATYFDPRNPVAIADAMEEVASDDRSTEERARRGVRRARKLTWERTARELLEAFEEAVS